MDTSTPSVTEHARHAMVASQLRTTAVNDARVIAAMSTIPRERYVGEANAEMAYRDRPLPLPGGRQQNTPLATGRLLTEAAIEPTDKVLLIGAAGGYTAAVLAEIAATVVAVEEDAVLAERARANLADWPNVTVVEASLKAGAPDHAPFDALVVDGAVEELPEALVAQVHAGGRIVSGVVDRGVAKLARGARSTNGFALLPFADIDCVVLPGFARPRAFTF
ncbi:protein-L-isoaspartate(D-aspartate) O-methyltransferase [Sphingomonas guangdongensis]|uniref:Protein-L-isoaspartate O-methyltransferase n=2 Tax=Sphingomonas guangdongensis TaxID=1141890 RepID=A0A285R2M9_9SPHN|nr:protein-L-isoaspartate(D-aspartate) O-methyltransferase [Sphingomonas guangdongensis]